jgi:hypothetical protein
MQDEPEEEGGEEAPHRGVDQGLAVEPLTGHRQPQPNQSERDLEKSHDLRKPAMAARKSGWDLAIALIRAPSRMLSSNGKQSSS